MNVLHFHRNRAVVEIDLADALLLANAVGASYPVAAPAALATLETVAVALRYLALEVVDETDATEKNDA